MAGKKKLSGKALKARAKELGIKGRSKMNADALRKAVAAAEAANANEAETENAPEPAAELPPDDEDFDLSFAEMTEDLVILPVDEPDPVPAPDPAPRSPVSTEELWELGLNERSLGALLLIPLIQVAWADGRIQAREAEIVHRVAAERGLLGTPEALELIDRLLHTKPSDDYFQLALNVIRKLGSPDTMRAGGAAKMIDLCQEVAEAAGGLFGLAFTVTKSERSAIDEIRRGLGIGVKKG